MLFIALVAGIVACFTFLSLIPAIIAVIISKEDVKVDIRDENIGLGHFTYFPSQGPEFQTSERTMPRALLDLCARYET